MCDQCVHETVCCSHLDWTLTCLRSLGLAMMHTACMAWSVEGYGVICATRFDTCVRQCHVVKAEVGPS